jgi:hypothetical protein
VNNYIGYSDHINVVSKPHPVSIDYWMQTIERSENVDNVIKSYDNVTKLLLEILHTLLGFLFPKVFPMFISYYPVSYILGRIFIFLHSRGLFSLVHTLVGSVKWSLDATLVPSPCSIEIITANVHCPWDYHQSGALLMLLVS